MVVHVSYVSVGIQRCLKIIHAAEVSLLSNVLQLVHCLTVTRFLLDRLYYDSMDYVVKIYIPTIETIGIY